MLQPAPGSLVAELLNLVEDSHEVASPHLGHIFDTVAAGQQTRSDIHRLTGIFEPFNAAAMIEVGPNPDMVRTDTVLLCSQRDPA